MSTSKYPNEIKINPNQGGKAAIERLVEAYGFTTRQALADHLEVSKSTLANRYMRDTFPADWIIQCAVETGTSLKWLVTGEGTMLENVASEIIQVKCSLLDSGTLSDFNYYAFDKNLLPQDIKKPEIVMSNNKYHIIERGFQVITDGKWILKIDDQFSIHELIRMPKEMVRISSGNLNFDCHKNDVEFYAFVFGTINHNSTHL